MAAKTTGVTGLLLRWREGDAGALDAIVPLVYRELRRLARNRLGRERLQHTLQATEIVHEAYLRLAGKEHPEWRDREHFYAVASLVMRRLLVDHARRRIAVRRGGERDRARVEIDEILDPQRAAELTEIDDLLTGLASFDRRKARIVELRFFAGMTIDETARALGISPMTVVREWKVARAWITQALSDGAGGSGRRGGQ